MDKSNHFLITCEHGGNRIPRRYRPYFLGHEDLLQTHRGYDPGALTMARELARQLAAPLYFSTASRLLIDLNRSIGHPGLYSEATRKAAAPDRGNILKRYYLPYRHKVETAIAEAVAQGSRVIHISSHSFTPELDGRIRNADIGLLYDPARLTEHELCRHWQAALMAGTPGLRVRRNYPYTGKSDGLAAYLRRRFPPDVYVGIELEINQKHVFKGGRQWRALREAIIAALHQAI
ncbi:MAG TPA: N-formylglutamate amidohydrolase [Sulfuricella sp.]|nr:N-formylglutamate amidohydrolase [Sulfuricella sp.]